VGGGATPAGRATPDAAGLSQAAMATPSPDQLGPRVVRAPDPRRTTGTRPRRPRGATTAGGATPAGGGATPDAAGSSQAALAHERNVVTEHRLHDAAAGVAYLQWYLPRMWTRVTYVPATTTATCPGPRQGPAERDLPGALRPDRRNSGKLRYCKHITFI
jgi:hypothetical protein